MRRLPLASVLISACLVCAHTGSYGQSAKPTKSASSVTKKVDAADGFSVGPAPAWVTEPVLTDEKSRGAIYCRLADEQLRLEGTEQSRYIHVIKVVNDVAGLSGVGNIRILFDPSYEALTFHKVDILRGGSRINALDKSRVKLLQRETKLEYQVYDGRVTASLALDDVRVGDTLDLAYTVKGSNPVFAGKYVDSVWMMASEGETSQMRFRLLAPEGRTIHYRASANTEVSSRKLGNFTETTFMRKPAPQWQGFESVPSDFYQRDQIRFSEFSDWNQIAVWGRSLFEQAKTPDAPALQEVVANIRRQATTPEEQIVMALDFVQKDIRYFGTEIGPYSHQPAEVGKVLSQRFGDCKDKASLLVAILRGLGIQAVPVLASQSLRDRVDESFATPYAFDHAIAKVELAGKSYWLDGTRQMQKGRLEQRESFGLGKTLVLEPTASQLSSTPSTKGQDQIQVDDVVTIRDWQAPVQLTSTTIFRGEIAESIRFALAQESMEKSQVWLSKDLSRVYPNLVQDKPPVVDDVADQNAVRVVQTFTVPKYWKYVSERRALSAEYVMWGMLSPIRFSNEINRTRPFQLGNAGVYRQTFRINFPETVVSKPSKAQRHESNRQLDLENHTVIDATAYTIEGVLRVNENIVDASEWTRYTEFLRKQESLMGGSFFVPTVTPVQQAQAEMAMRDMTKSWDGLFSSNKPKTKVQTDAAFKKIVLSAQINSGRLSPDLLAGVLRERGVQLDNAGAFTQAKSDFDRALQLAPDNAEIYSDAAINAFSLNQDALAEQYIRKAMELSPNTQSYRRTLARLRYFSGDYANAKKELLESLKNTPDAYGGYGLIELGLVAKRLNENAFEAIAPYNNNPKPEWPYPIVLGMGSNAGLEAAIKIARSNGKDDSDLCEAYFYAAENLLIDGKRDEAKKYFQKTVDTGVVEYIEYAMAKRRLASL